MTLQISIKKEETKEQSKKTIPKISLDDLDESRHQSDKERRIKSAEKNDLPFIKTINHMTRLLQRTQAPMQKLIDLVENRDVLAKELEAYQKKNGVRFKVAGQDQKDLILRYILIQSEVGDLFCQRTVLDEFVVSYIKANADGNLLAKVFLDFTSAVDFLQSLDKKMLLDREQGPLYIQEYNLHCLENRLYCYPDDERDDLCSIASSYNMFGGFREADTNCDKQSFVSNGRHGSALGAKQSYSKNSLKMKS